MKTEVTTSSAGIWMLAAIAALLALPIAIDRSLHHADAASVQAASVAVPADKTAN